MNRIFITGDTHGLGDFRKLKGLQETHALTQDDFIIIAGDCGVVWHKDLLQEFKAQYLSLGASVLFIDGNHENFEMLNKYKVELWNGGKVHKIECGIIHLMRGQVYDICGKTFFCMGGGNSHDKNERKKGENWWQEELISPEDALEAETNLSRHDWHVDYVVTHIPPYAFMHKIVLELTQCGERIPYYLENKLVPTDSCDMLERIAQKIQYKKWYSGHLHIDTEIGKYCSLYERIVKIYDGGNNGNIRVKVGIFWVLPDGKIYVKEELVAIDKPIVDSKFAHFAEWDKIASRYPDADFASYPRGRVVFDTENNRHIVYADRCIGDRSLETICKRFAASGKYIIARDEHYSCDKCTPKNLFY